MINHHHDYNMEIRSWVLAIQEKAGRLSQMGLLQPRPCPVCQSQNLKPYVHNGALAYDQCQICQLIFQNPTLDPQAVNDGFMGEDPLLRRYFDIVARYKIDRLPEEPDPTRHSKLCDIYAHKTSGKLLDVGCSVGDFMHVAKFFYDVEGVEINPITATLAARHFTVYTDYLERLALPPVYDLVTLHQILYGVPDPLALLRDIRALLKPDGLLYLNTPNGASYATQLFGGKCCHFYGYTSLNVFSPNSLEALTQRAGFKIRSLRTEWLDIYSPDIQEFYSSTNNFIHKRNCHRPHYEDLIAAEDALHRDHPQDLGLGGNYIVAILEKTET